MPVLLAAPDGRPRRAGLIDRRGAALALPILLLMNGAALIVGYCTGRQGEITGIG